jgi:hypothetical protein
MRESARSVLVELLADELKELVAWSVSPERLAMKPVLRDWAAIPPGLPRSAAGGVIWRELEGAISSLDGYYTFQGNKYDAHTMNWAYRVLLGFERGNEKADRRRERVMEKLGVYHTVVAWRRNLLNERAFLVILAEHMTR